MEKYVIFDNRLKYAQRLFKRKTKNELFLKSTNKFRTYGATKWLINTKFETIKRKIKKITK